MQTLAIIGAGLSGTLCLINLVRNNEDRMRIFIIDKSEKPGFGLAYSKLESHLLLNAPVNQMSAFEDEPEHFFNWLQKYNYDYRPEDYAPRFLYGSYIHELYINTLAQQSNDLEIHFLKNEAVDIELFTRKAFVHLEDGNLVMSDKVILALGNFPAMHTESGDRSYLKLENYIDSPWQKGIFENIDKHDNILIIGTGLTMVDVTTNLYHQGHRGYITAISKHGQLPKVHKTKATTSEDYFAGLSSGADLNEIYAFVKEKLKQDNWEEVIDNLKLHFNSLWSRLTLNDKKRFYRHFYNKWLSARHRMPAQVAEIIKKLKSEEKLVTVAANIEEIRTIDNCLETTLYLRKVQEYVTLKTNWVINCEGQEGNYERINNKLVQKLIKSGLLRNDPLNMGINATPQGALIDASGKSSAILYTLGPPLKGILGESSSVNEIRHQAHQLSSLFTNQKKMGSLYL